MKVKKEGVTKMMKFSGEVSKSSLFDDMRSIWFVKRSRIPF